MSTLPKSKSRTITIDTPGGPHPFRWMVGSGKGRLIGMSGPGLVLTVQANGPHGGLLQMHLFSKAYALQDDYNEEHTGLKSTLHPKDVKKVIEYALKSGWDPNDKKQKGNPFKLKGPLDLEEYELP